MEQVEITPRNYELAAQVYEQRYNEVAERVQDPERSFVAFLHTWLADAPVHIHNNQGIGVPGRIYDRNFKRTQDEISMVFEQHGRSLEEGNSVKNTQLLINWADKALRDKNEPVSTKLQMLCILGLAAGSAKPDGAVDTMAIHRTVRGQNDAVMLFTGAVTKIKRQLLSTEDIEKLDFNTAALRNPATSMTAVRRINRFCLHLYAKAILERLGAPETRWREVHEDSLFLDEKLRRPNPRRPRFDINEQHQVVTVGWPIFPPDPTRKPAAAKPPSRHEPPSEERKAELKAIREQREAFVAFFVGLWGPDAFTIEAEMRTKGRPYTVAILPYRTPEGVKVDAFAESPDVENALFALRHENVRGTTIDTTNKETVTESLKTIFGATKTDAEAFGAVRITHGTQRMAEVLLEYLTRSPEELAKNPQPGLSTRPLQRKTSHAAPAATAPVSNAKNMV